MAKSDKDEYELLVANTKHILESQGGRDVIWHMLSLCDLYTDGFTGDSRESYISGKKSVGYGILQLLEDVDPAAYGRLLITQHEVQIDD